MRKLICLGVLLLMAFTALAAAADDLKCATCGRVIKKTKHYLEFDGKPYCSQACFEAALPKCATCGKAVGDGARQGEFLKYKGKIYCSQACFEAALPTCATCGKPVNGGIVADNKHYCGQECHQQSLPRCEACGKPVTAAVYNPLEPSKLYCSQECYSITLPCCSICGVRMQNWRELDGKTYCKTCDALPRCADCGHPGADARLPDKRSLCATCLKTAVFDTAAARSLFEQVRREIKDRLGLATEHAIGFHLVDLKALNRVTKTKSAAEKGFYSSRAGTDQHIYILNGLLPEDFKDAAAHELAHDILAARHPAIVSRLLQEGFAEYVASLMATAWNAERLNERRARNEVKIYANGYQKFLKIAKDGGLPAVLEYLRKQGRAR